MSVINPHEIWQVDVGGQVYEAPFAELSDWISEGSLHPEDKVRKGNLRWIEARRVPTLIPFFNAKAEGRPMPVVVSTSEPDPTEAPAPPAVLTENILDLPPVEIAAEPVDHTVAAVPAEPIAKPFDPNHCAIHPNVETVFLCDGCGNGFCRACPKSYGGTVKICPFCGAMCKPLAEVQQRQAAAVRRTAVVNEGFGIADFFNALGHPFKFKASLIFGALMFMAFTLGQAVTAIGGIYMLVAAIFCAMLANMLAFGVLANTIDNFTRGNLESDFMPSFENFELWDDVIHPFFLSIGAYLSAFGPLFAVLILGAYLILSSVGSEMNSFQQDVQRIPGTQYYDNQRAVDQSKDVKDVLAEINSQQAKRLERLNAARGEEEVLDADPAAEMEELKNQSARETREQEELWAMAQEHRKQSFEAALGKSPETRAKEKEEMVEAFFNLAAPLVVIGGIFLLWGLFYYPAACAVAGYTRSFMATVNPLVGLDTIKRLGGSYVKVLMMTITLLLVYLVFSGIVAVVLSPLDLPGFGNLPAMAISALFLFYLTIVFACVIGYAMFKKSDKLGLVE